MSDTSNPPGAQRPQSDDEKARQAKAESMRDAGKYAGLGLSLAATLCVFTWGGYVLDQRFDSLPLFLLVGVFAGGGLGTYSLIKKVSAGSSSPPNHRD
ncbi:MAG: F0F1-type ATP synthase assembly protein I [Planctomycetota bacterium]|jgi:F0F1-type ATP synthase assembly protein I